MNVLPAIMAFVADAALVAAAAWVGWGALRRGREDLVETTLGWLLLALSWIVASGVLLGLAGGLGRTGFLLCHAVGLAVLLAVRRSGRDDARLARAWLADGWQLLGRGNAESVVLAAGVAGFLTLAILLGRAEPIVFDALTYRLSRIGQWLQDGRIANLATDDPRMNYMPVGPDLVVAWLLGATESGFRLAALSQLAGAVLLLGATYGLARSVGLVRQAAVGAVVLVLGMANVVAQFTTIQSDLFTAGIFGASYLLWHRAWLRGEGSWVAGIGVALAWGSKGTMFYLAPGIALWVAWLVWRHRHGWRPLATTAAGAGLALAVFVGPSYWRNEAAYGSVFGPREAVVLHHGEPLTLPQHAEKLGLNLVTSAVQLLDPPAQPFWARDLTGALGRRLLPLLPADDDRYLFLHTVPRRVLAEGLLQQVEPDADLLSCGALAVGLLLVGTSVAAVRATREPAATQILVWSGGVFAYVLAQHALVQWHQWGFRFMVLAAPWVGVVGAWVVSRWPRRAQVVAWAVIGLSSFQVFVVVQVRTKQAAWQAGARPDANLSYFIYRHWRSWAAQLEQPATPLTLAFPINHPLAAFYRTIPARPVALARFSALPLNTAEAAVPEDGGWLVVPAVAFRGREGEVVGRTWLFNGDGTSLHSVAAFRKLQPGESPPAMLYRYSDAAIPDGLRRQLLVKSWRPQVHLRLRNPAAGAWRFEVQTVLGHTEGELAAGAEVLLPVAVPAGTLTEVAVSFHATAGPHQAAFPTVTLALP